MVVVVVVVVHFSNNMIDGVSASDEMFLLNMCDDGISPVHRVLTFAAFVEDLLGVDGVDVIRHLTHVNELPRAVFASLTALAVVTDTFAVYTAALAVVTDTVVNTVVLTVAVAAVDFPTELNDVKGVDTLDFVLILQMDFDVTFIMAGFGAFATFERDFGRIG